MKRRRVFLATALLFSMLIAAKAYALFRYTEIEYYYDDTFQTWVGYWDENCEGYISTNNVVGSWRIYDQFRCSDDVHVVHKCQQTDGMGGWINVGCP